MRQSSNLYNMQGFSW